MRVAIRLFVKIIKKPKIHFISLLAADTRIYVYIKQLNIFARKNKSVNVTGVHLIRTNSEDSSRVKPIEYCTRPV